jgi:hypothetical protein
MIEAAYSHAATLLRDGTVLVAGSGTSAEQYDPSSGSWTATESMQDGRVLVMGGDGGSGTIFGPLASAELHNLGSGR